MSLLYHTDCDKMYMDKDLIEDKQYQLIDKLNRRQINHREIYFVLLHNIIYLYNTSIYIIC